MSKSTLKQTLAEFRAKHFKEEMNRNLEVAREIRDNPENSAKDRNEALKSISRMLGALAPEKVSPISKPKKSKKEELTELDKLDIQKIINETNQVDNS